ncbi:MAG: bifunctional [glutamate--ammonia ligase]-adenylyl-L-tyrosine phosphorylase/[glutamate--ammonia-ligase] adenylyltransferase [Gammaproteobacteria bacterium]
MAINRQRVEPPSALRESLNDAWESYAAAAADAGLPLPCHPDFTASLRRVWACSDFVSGACIRDPSLLHGLLSSGDLLADSSVGEYERRLGLALRGVDEETGLGEVLRDFRRREMVRIAWRDLAGWDGLDAVLADLSSLADACIAAALDRLGRWSARQYTAPRTEFFPELVVLGMGKLGAGELNFSSDVDLIFAHPGTEPPWLKSELSAEEFYTRLGRQLIQMLDQVTARGFVFRVDMRLRPYGDSGPLVAGFDAMADYYQLQGREWERYAMIKARPVAGPPRAATDLMALLKPFVYRRYLDFGAFDSLRNLKEQIAREVERRQMRDNIKLGPGGIREIEFIAQAFQLVRGGRQVLLQQRGVLAVLDALALLGYLPEQVCSQLAEAYIFLRRVENRLQAFADQQVHELPEDESSRMRLAYAMDFLDWEAFSGMLDEHRRTVQGHFEQVFAAPETRAMAAKKGKAPALAGVWTRVHDAGKAAAVLKESGYEDAQEILRWLEGFRKGPAVRFLGEQGRQRLDRLMPMLLEEAAAQSRPDQALKSIGTLLEAITGRTTYLSLLVENPPALSQLVRLCSSSIFVSDQLTQHPILLDELLDPRSLYNPLDKDGLKKLLEIRLNGIAADDLEQQMDRLRQFQQAAMLHVAATDIVSRRPVAAIANNLTDIAEVVLERVLRLAWDHLVRRYGPPGYRWKGKQHQAHFAILGYGKLGGYELGYGSDLDLVFLHDSRGDEQQTAGPQLLHNNAFFTRLSQRIIHIMNTFTPAGILYEVDMRLRPNGASGLLVSSLEAFADYQSTSAWTWENQALVRARVVAGDINIAQQFEKIRTGVLTRPREAAKLGHEVCEMRRRMRQELDKSDAQRFDLKQGRGGIVDIEFMVQWSVLLWSAGHPELLAYTDNLRLLEILSRAGLMPAEDVTQLTDVYFAIRRRINHLALQEQPPVVENDELASHREAVVRIWDRYLGPYEEVKSQE